MYVLAFAGSPRKDGNTDILLRQSLEPFKQANDTITLIRLNTLKITPCQHCGGCEHTGKCIIKDDMTEIYEHIYNADRIILASPIFFFSLSAQSKLMIDRAQAFWCAKYLLKREIPAGQFGRKGLLLLAGGMHKDIGVKNSEAIARAFFRTISVPTHDTLSFLGIDAKGDILKHPTALEDAYSAGKRLREV